MFVYLYLLTTFGYIGLKMNFNLDHLISCCLFAKKYVIVIEKFRMR